MAAVAALYWREWEQTKFVLHLAMELVQQAQKKSKYHVTSQLGIEPEGWLSHWLSK